MDSSHDIDNRLASLVSGIVLLLGVSALGALIWGYLDDSSNATQAQQPGRDPLTQGRPPVSVGMGQVPKLPDARGGDRR